MYSGEQIAQNYQALVERWGEMHVTEFGSFQIKYIDIQKAFFNGASITYLTLAIVFLVAAIALGKILFPQLCNMYKSANDQLADLAAIQTQEVIKRKEKEWF